MNEKEELILIVERLIKIRKYYESKVSENMNNKKILKELGQISMYLTSSHRNLESAIFHINKLDKINGEKYKQ